MAMTVRYTNINGQIVAEKRSGTRKFYSSDALGSTVSLYSGVTKTDAFTYWPYGETRTRTGSTPTKYKFVGTLGCREQADGGIYMRARVEEPEDGRWMTVDPLWPVELSYGFVWGSPASMVDPSGLNAMSARVRPMPPNPGVPPPLPIDCTKAWNAYIYAFCNRCRFHPLPTLCYLECDQMAREYYRRCDWKPGPGSGRFGPPPDGSVGEIAPRPGPPPGYHPAPTVCIMPAPIPVGSFEDFSECRGFAQGKVWPYGTIIGAPRPKTEFSFSDYEYCCRILAHRETGIWDSVYYHNCVNAGLPYRNRQFGETVIETAKAGGEVVAPKPFNISH